MRGNGRRRGGNGGDGGGGALLLLLLLSLLFLFFMLDSAALGMHVGQVIFSCTCEDLSLAVVRLAFNGEEFMHFEYSSNKFVAKHPLAEPYAEGLNNNERVINNFAQCIRRMPLVSHIIKEGIRAETAKPAITITSRHPNAHGHPLVLTCRVDGFYPRDINTTWLQNGKDIDREVLRSNVLANVDGTFQMRLQLNVDPSRIGDTYSCQITHRSVPDKLTAVWVPQNQNVPVYGYVVGIMAGLVGILIAVSGGVMRWKGVSAVREDTQLCEDVTSLPRPVSADVTEV